MTMPAVELRGVNKTFGSFSALKDFDLVVPPGAFFCLLGASGSGKSTALRIIAGLESATSGEIRIDGEVVNSVPANKRPSNMVFQSYGLFPRMDVFDNVAYGLRSRKTPKDEIDIRVREALELVRMTDQRDKRPKQLSGGQAQRVALARALVNEPSVLLLDEPLGALDLVLRRQVQQELAELQARTNKTFIHVTHDQEEVFAIATHVAILDDGQLQQVGSPEEIYRKPKNAFVATFIGLANLIPVHVTENLNDGYLVDGPLGGARAGAWTPLSVGSDAHLVVRPEDIDIRDVTHEPWDGSTQGTLVSRTRTASTVQLTVRVGEVLLIVEQSASPTVTLAARVGDPVAVRINRERGWLVHADGNSSVDEVN